MMVADAREEIARDVQLLGDPHECLVRLREEPLDLGGKEGVVADLDPSVEHAPDRGASCRDGASAVQELVAEVGDSHPDAARRPRVERVFELLDLGVRRVERLQEAVRDLVDEPLDEHSRGR